MANPDIEKQVNDGMRRAAEVRANPDMLLAGLPKPGIVQTLASGLQAGLAVPVDTWADPSVSALRGISAGFGGFQQAQASALEQSPFEQVAPRLAEEFPMLKGMPAKMATDMLKTLSGYFSAQAKPQAQVFGPGDLSTITTQLVEVKKYSPEDAAKVAPTLIGQPWSALGNIPSRERAKRREMTYETKFNEYGIPTGLTGYDAITDTINKVSNDSGKEITKSMVSLAKGKKALDVVYDNFNKITDADKRALSSAMSKLDVGYGNVIGNEEAFMQKVKNAVGVVKAKYGAGEKEGEKLDALIAVMSAQIPMIARGLGHTGVLTELDVMKSFGILPDPKGTVLSNQERRRLYNETLRAQADALVDSFTPIEDEAIDRAKMYRKIGLDVSAPATSSATPSLDSALDDILGPVKK